MRGCNLPQPLIFILRFALLSYFNKKDFCNTCAVEFELKVFFKEIQEFSVKSKGWENGSPSYMEYIFFFVLGFNAAPYF